MSLYDLLFGQNADAAHLLQTLGLSPAQIPRFRDVYWDGLFIVVHTRTGGGNREFYESEASCRNNYPDYFEDPTKAPKGPWNEDLRKIPGYVRDEDEEYDCTYANFYFRPPAELEETLKGLPADMPPSEKWAAVFKALDEQGAKRKDKS